MTSGKRVFDLAVAAPAAIIAAPIAVLIALAVRLGSRGPVLYRGERVGRGGTTFLILKFRTMRVGAVGTAVTAAHDPRVTRVGRLLRASKLDELPQLWNVLRGDMSLVGPRPEDPRYVATYTPEQRELLRYRPGLTSAASVHFRNEESLLEVLPGDVDSAYREMVMPAKLAVDAAYFRQASLVRDACLLGRTIVAVVSPPSLESQLERLDRVLKDPPHASPGP